MKISGLCLAATFLTSTCLFADLTIVQKIEGAGSTSEMMVKIKGDLIRVDPSPEISSIINNKTGEMITIMHPQKAFMKISGEQAKAMMAQAKGPNASTPAKSPELKATGEKETIENTEGKFEAEKYTFTTAGGIKGTYWIVKNYPNAAKILTEMSNMAKGPIGESMSAGVPDPTSLPGFPIKSTLEVTGQSPVTATVFSVKETPISDADFKTPEGYQTMSMPGMGGEGKTK